VFPYKNVISQMWLYRNLSLNKCYFKNENISIKDRVPSDLSKDEFVFVECEIILKEEIKLS
jgi:hypothetical protein